LTPRSRSFGKFSCTVGFIAKGQDFGQITMEYGVDAFAAVARVQLNAVD
jgi:hypothetical protein